MSHQNDITPFDVNKVTDYNRIITQFGCTAFKENDELFDRFEKLTGTKIPIGYKKYLISHREFDAILDAYERREHIYLYTGRGPSSENMHLGHLIPFKFTKFLQDAFNVPLIIQITDDEKFIFKDLTMEQIEKMAKENIKDIIACGFNIDKTFIFLNSKSMNILYPMVLKIQKLVTLKEILNTFGFPIDGTDTLIGKVAFPPVQAAPAFAETFLKHFQKNGIPISEKEIKKIRCLVPCAIDQDPYFRMCRSISNQLKHSKPALIHFRFLPSLDGVDTKMSSSNPGSCVFLTDNVSQIRKKINKSFSGGKETLEEHKLLGGDTDVDVPFQLLNFFIDDEETLKALEEGFRSGSIMCSEMKSKAIEEIVKHVDIFKNERKRVTDEVIDIFTNTAKILPF